MLTRILSRSCVTAVDMTNPESAVVRCVDPKWRLPYERDTGKRTFTRKQKSWLLKIILMSKATSHLIRSTKMALSLQKTQWTMWGEIDGWSKFSNQFCNECPFSLSVLWARVRRYCKMNLNHCGLVRMLVWWVIMVNVQVSLNWLRVAHRLPIIVKDIGIV